MKAAGELRGAELHAQACGVQAAVATFFGKHDALKKFKRQLTKGSGGGGGIERFARTLAQVVELPTAPVRSR